MNQLAKRRNQPKPTLVFFSSAEALPLAKAMQNQLASSCQVKLWHQGMFKPGESYIVSIQATLAKADFAAIICHTDDKVSRRKKTYQVPRDNVILEAGLSIATLGSDRTYLIIDSTQPVELPTDLAGRTQISFTMHADGDIDASVGQACHKIEKRVHELGFFESEVSRLKASNEQLKQELQGAISRKKIDGKRLFQHIGYYPIDLDANNVPTINVAMYVNAMHHFLQPAHYDKRAVTDLIYLREDNLSHTGDFLTDEQLLLYNDLVAQYNIDVEQFMEDSKRQLDSYIRLVNDLGDSFGDVCVEFLLHNVRNPLRSIVAAKDTDTISKRRLGDPSTRFVYQFVKHQGRALIKGMEDGSKVAYEKQLLKDKRVKATTTPIYDAQYGLIAILCVNFDVDTIASMTNLEKARFFANYCKISGQTPSFEQ